MASFLRQFLCTVAVCLLSFNVSIIFSWPSSTLEIFQSTNTTLHRPMTPTEISLFGSLSSFGALFSTPLAGYFLDSIGRKYCTLLATLTLVIFWGLVSICNRVEVILLATFISGGGSIMFLIQPIYTGEFCADSIRGAMSSVGVVTYSLGMLLSYLLGGLLTYHQLVYTCLSISIASITIISFVKESPVTLMQKGLKDEAAKSISFFRNIEIDSKEVLEEIANIKRILNAGKSTVTQEEEEKLNKEEEEKDNGQINKTSIWKFIKRSKSTRQALYVLLVILFLTNLQGLLIVQVYAAPLFSEALPNVTPTLCTVLLAVVSTVASTGSSALIDFAGRKVLMVYTSLIAWVCCILIGTQLQFHWLPYYLTAIIIYVFCVACIMGGAIVPFVLVGEVFLPEIRSFASALMIEWAWLSTFIGLFVFNPLVSTITLGGVFYIFAGVSFLLQIYCMSCLPETKGLPVDAIQLLFAPKKRADVNNC